MPKNRKFTRSDIDAIVHLIHTWPRPSISWEDVCCKSEPILGFLPSRQGLNQKDEILSAFQLKKKGDQTTRETAVRSPSSLAVAGRRISELTAEVAKLKIVNSSLRDRFQMWQYNAHLHGMSQSDLDRPLPKIDR